MFCLQGTADQAARSARAAFSGEPLEYTQPGVVPTGFVLVWNGATLG